MRHVLRRIVSKIKRLAAKKFSLSVLLKLPNIIYIYKLLRDQPYVKRQSEKELVSFRTGLVPKLGKVAKDFVAENEKHRNLDMIVDCLKAIGAEYFIIPNAVKSDYRVGVPANNKEKFLEELSRRYSDKGVYIATTEGLPNRQVVSSRRSLKRFCKADAVRIYSFILSPIHDLLFGEAEGCLVDFWEANNNEERRDYLEEQLIRLRVNVEVDMLANTLIAPTENDFTGVLPLDEVKVTTLTIGGKKYRTYDVFAQKTISSIDFPIDIVYAWVDGNDPKWKAKFNKYKGIVETASERNNTESRYKDRQELKYSLRSLHMYAPFVRNIYIVTDDQTPDWLNTSAKGIKVVSHKDIFTDPSVLPVFNSHAIGAQLHHIKGLSDRYLYLNDDMMFGRPVTPQKFFYASGIARVAASPALIHAGKPQDYEPAPSSAGKNVRKALQGSFDRYITNKFKHSPNPQIKEVAYEIEEKYPDIVKQTASSRFRSKTDVQFASSFHHSYSLITGRAVLTNMRSAVVNISQDGVQGTLDQLLKRRDCYTICLNESETPEDRQEEVEEMVNDFLNRYYPYPSPWEKQ